jgi:hypothetical protein
MDKRYSYYWKTYLGTDAKVLPRTEFAGTTSTKAVPMTVVLKLQDFGLLDQK